MLQDKKPDRETHNSRDIHSTFGKKERSVVSDFENHHGAPTVVPRAPTRFEYLAFAAVLVPVALAPWPLGSNRPWAWSALFLAACALLLLLGAGLVLGLLRPARLPGSVRFALALALLVVAWIALQTAPFLPARLAHPIWALLPTEFAAQPTIAINPTGAREALMRLLVAITFLIGGYVLGAQRALAELLPIAVLVLVTLEAVFAFARLVFGIEELFGYTLPLARISGSFVNPNHFAAYVNFGVVIAFLLLLDSARRQADAPRLRTALARLLKSSLEAHPLLAAALAACLLALAASASRGAALALLFTLLVLIGAGLRGTRLPLVLAGSAFLLVLLGVAIASGGGFLWERLSHFDPASEFSPGIAGRASIWAWSVERIAERPWLGHGYGGFLALFEHARDARFPSGGPWDYAHNTYLELAVELGVPAAAALALAVVLALRPCFQALRYGTRSVLPLIAIAVTLVQALHGLVDFAWQIPAVNLTWALLLGAGVGRAAATLARLRTREH